MVLLTVTVATRKGIEEYCKSKSSLATERDKESKERLEKLSRLSEGDPIEHDDVIEVSRFLLKNNKKEHEETLVKEWRLETFLKGAVVYRPPPPEKPEPVCTTSILADLDANDFSDFRV